ncbi:MAG: hypothetical protein AAFX40_08425 [Cyanobacteria bacterium J06639_1]
MSVDRIEGKYDSLESQGFATLGGNLEKLTQTAGVLAIVHAQKHPTDRAVGGQAVFGGFEPLQQFGAIAVQPIANGENPLIASDNGWLDALAKHHALERNSPGIQSLLARDLWLE